MTSDHFSSTLPGWTAIAASVMGLPSLGFIRLFYAVSQPFGTLNDIFTGLTGLLGAVLARTLYSVGQLINPFISTPGMILDVLGALLAAAGSLIVICSIRGWYLAGLYMSLGNALIGLWLLGWTVSLDQGISLPHGLVVFGIVIGCIMASGLVVIPAILIGVDSW